MYICFWRRAINESDFFLYILYIYKLFRSQTNTTTTRGNSQILYDLVNTTPPYQLFPHQFHGIRVRQSVCMEYVNLLSTYFSIGHSFSTSSSPSKPTTQNSDCNLETLVPDPIPSPDPTTTTTTHCGKVQRKRNRRKNFKQTAIPASIERQAPPDPPTPFIGRVLKKKRTKYFDKATKTRRTAVVDQKKKKKKKKMPSNQDYQEDGGSEASLGSMSSRAGDGDGGQASTSTANTTR